MSDDERSISRSEFPSNTNRDRFAKPEKKKDKDDHVKKNKVVAGDTKFVEKPLGKRIVESFTGATMAEVGTYVLFEVIIPAAKDLLFESLKEGIQRKLYGDSRPRVGTSSSIRPVTTVMRTAYNEMTKPKQVSRPDISPKARAQHDFREVSFADRSDAERVLAELEREIAEYEATTVSTFYELVGLNASYQDRVWGWEDIRGAGVRRLPGGGFVIDLPNPKPLES